MSTFVRQLGAEPGVQLNPLRDESEIPATGNSDQVLAVLARLTRGPIHKPFRVDRGNFKRKAGKGESIRVNALNEAWAQTYEALNAGAYEAIVQRLVPATATVEWAIISPPVAPSAEFEFSVAATLPATEFLLAIKHLECHNDGIRVEIHADENREGGVDNPQNMVSIRIRDATDNSVLHAFTGSLDSLDVDDYNQSVYLPDVVSRSTDMVEVVVGSVASVDPGSFAYGYDALSREKWATSPVLSCFTEGGTTYTVTDYVAATDKIRGSNQPFGYIMSGGTQDVALLAELARLSFDTNRQLRYDIHGALSVDAAIAFAEQLNMGSSETAHLIHGFWAPIKSADPSGINPRGFLGASGFNIGRSCSRNAQKNAKGFAPKNCSIAGRNYPLQRTSIEPVCTPTNQELNRLAKAKIIPVLFESYAGGGLYVFRDVLTSKPTDNSLTKLISTAEMATDIEERMTSYASEIKFLPMSIAVKRMQDFLETMLADAETSGWLVPSDDPAMEGRSYQYVARPNEARPYDVMDFGAWVRFDGVTRQLFATLTLTR